MKTNDFICNLNYFSKTDLKSFENFLLSPYVNTSKSILTVYRMLTSQSEKLLSEELENLKPVLIAKLNYSESTVVKILSELNELFVYYSKLQMFAEDKIYGDYLCCRYLLKQGNYGFLGKRLKKLSKEFTKIENIDEEMFFRLYEKDILQYGIISTSNDNLNPESKLDKQKKSTCDSALNLMVYTISKVTINFINYVIQCNDCKDGENESFPVNMERMFEFINTSEFNSYNAIQKTTIKIFFKAYKLFSKPLSDRCYNDYKNYFNSINHQYNVSFCRTHINILLSYCYMRQRIQDIKKFYTSEALAIQYEFFKNGYYKNSITDYLHPIMFRNYVINCLDACNKDILYDFVINYSEKLNPTEVELMKAFGMAHYYFLNNEYVKSLKELSSLHNPKALYRYDINNLIIKNYFEKGDFINVERCLHNYKEYIETDEYLTNYDKERYNVLVDIMNAFISKYNKYVSKDKVFVLEHLLIMINEKNSFVMKNWIKNKVTELILNHYKSHPNKVKK